jgi:Leu/Phe-tRNA-protein transferase
VRGPAHATAASSTWWIYRRIIDAYARLRPPTPAYARLRRSAKPLVSGTYGIVLDED